MSFLIPRTERFDFMIDPAGVRGTMSKVGPRPVSFNPSISFGWQLTKGLRLGPELRYGGGAGAIIGIGLVWQLP